MATTNRGGGAHHSQINVTPLVDVVLVLLIIFMVIVPVAQRAHELDVPVQAPRLEREQDETPDQIVLRVDARRCPSPGGLPEIGLPYGCRVELAEVEIGIAGLASAVERAYADRDRSSHVLFLDAGDDLEYELVMRVVDAARTRMPGLRIGLVADPRPVSSVLISNATPAGAPAEDQ